MNMPCTLERGARDEELENENFTIRDWEMKISKIFFIFYNLFLKKSFYKNTLQAEYFFTKKSQSSFITNSLLTKY